MGGAERNRGGKGREERNEKLNMSVTDQSGSKGGGGVQGGLGLNVR